MSVFEVQDLIYATLATVSRCGMIWFSEEVLTVEMICYNFLHRLGSVFVEPEEEELSEELPNQVSPLRWKQRSG